MERKRRFQTRAQYNEQKEKSSPFYKMDKMLNYLIAIVAILIVVTLGWIVSRDDEPSEKAEEQQQQADKPPQDAKGTGEEDDKEQSGEGQTTGDNEQGEKPEQDADEVVTPSTDPNVLEVRTNENWPAYPTAQTGEHFSTFEKGHIDYEEKLKAIFSVLDIEQENSYVWRIGNNGSAQTAIAIVYAQNKEKIYRVSIEWVDGEGWKPMKYDVLNSLPN